jgi:hypothetical protein
MIEKMSGKRGGGFVKPKEENEPQMNADEH